MYFSRDHRDDALKRGMPKRVEAGYQDERCEASRRAKQHEYEDCVQYRTSHRASSLNPSRISVLVSASSPACLSAAATAAEACTCA